ncbi:hypothetical protein BBO99_00000045 [Phytophthora kernoviae]|uniref:Uncharacterized protein n=2 Tax=Phytophthora kernoviae TaxID=325452 RepID=A0A3R7IKJ3_9STRA|nr:hypothetical protein G195_004690 [Phytophthora kernoviae 00238/432]KAG2533035.1 hypothetical protein JM16_000189 [Phytophthora kernoviae]KAG2533329.1 hypothetical protein JM18_000164 [Phytophthora kernoviae]RLN26905.1 hypothetical protein BBI17_000045 [Phytophthora kernoviae]RLN85933.1 hypothetical protein BBO99_00000045 [Phytophthora kernoviae]
MVSSGAWTAVATATALAVVPLAAWQYQRYMELKGRRDAMKLLRKVDLIASEVGVRLLHLENQVHEFMENQDKQDAETEEDPAVDSTLNSYYHFDSQGNKLKTKWDSYDADAELERLEKEEQGEGAPSTATSSKKPARQAPQVSKQKLLSTAGGIEHEFEAVLSFLDDIRGDDDVKELRKAIATKVNKEHFLRIDAVRTLLA